MMKKHFSKKVYPAKILLFGEYTVIQGGDSLAIPFYGFYAEWQFSNEKNKSKEELRKYVAFFKTEVQNIIDVSQFEKELDNGLYLYSNIPTGYGVGSSGSVVAAIYDRFALIKTNNLTELRNIFRWMESYFHGESSGIDPLVSYLDKAVHIESNILKTIKLEEKHRLLDLLFLWNSSTNRSTSPLVNWYKKEYENGSFQNEIIQVLLPAVKNVINAFLENNKSEFEKYFQEIARLQQTLFIKMINAETVSLIQENDSDAIVKLCGAGGGGFYLVLSDKKIQNKSFISLTTP